MRTIQPFIEKDLARKMVFLAGPRQVGKTHLGLALQKKLGGKYYNWDLAEDRQLILEKGFLEDRLVILDELHKYDQWKNFLKGVYDKYHESLRMLVTGSARLDIYRRGGDSLMGRYFLYHLHPYSMREASRAADIPRPEESLAAELPPARELMEQLLKFGGFPEPFLGASEESHRRWSLQRREILVQQDVRDLTNIQSLSLIEHLLLLIPNRVASVLSINALREDLRVAYNTVVAWLETLERLYVIFSLKPFSTRVTRTVHKEKKIYLWDWSQIKDPGARFENFIASHLWKAVQFWQDLGYGEFGLFFLRDRDRREVDFCITRDHQPWLLVEAKLSDSAPAEPLDFYANKLNVPGIQLIAAPDHDRRTGRVRVVSADRWLLGLP